jgi:phosphoserine phosphatase
MLRHNFVHTNPNRTTKYDTQAPPGFNTRLSSLELSAQAANNQVESPPVRDIDMHQPPIKLIVLDVDGTLIRKQTICQIIAKNIDKLDRMNWLEENAAETRDTLIAAHCEMAGWYLELGKTATLQAVDGITWAPNVHKSLKSIRESGIVLALASITWDFAVHKVASELGITQIRATELNWTSGDIVHMFP